MCGEAISQACHKAKALSDDAKVASFGEANVFDASGEATSKAYYKPKALASEANNI